ncbi:MAG: carboxypeptidase regulatory-like domain-containing protein, partial [Endomicrobia bacterium]|nr:carboxypeptidase regulatory-like domain-containing protein [Endomicrobiia bacterium]
QSSQVWYVGIDTTAPTNVDVSAEPPYTKGTTNTVSWSSSSDNLSGISVYIVEVSSNPDFEWITDTVLTTENSVTFLDLEDSVTYYYRVKARDKANNESQEWSNVVWSLQDATPPDMFDLVMSSGIVNTNTITLSWTASNDFGSGLVKYQLWIDNQLKKDNIPPTVTSTTVYLSEGLHSFYVKAVDFVGNETNTGIWEILIDTTPPQLTIVSPINNSYIESLNIISGTAQDFGVSPSGIDKVVLVIKRQIDNYTWTGSSWSANNNYLLAQNNSNIWFYNNITTSYLTPNTSYSISAFTLDNAYNQSQMISISFMYVPIQEGTITGYVVSSVENKPLEGAVVEILKNSQVIVTTHADSLGNYLVTVVTGVYTMRASSTGYSTMLFSGVEVNYQQIKNVNFTLVDVTSPIPFNLLSPQNSSWYNTNNITFSWEHSNDKESGLLGYKLYVDGQLVQDNISSTQTVTTLFVSEAENLQWYVVAVDKVGNKTQTATYTLNIDTTPPKVLSSFPKNNTVVDIYISSVVFVFNDHMDTSVDVRSSIFTNLVYPLDISTITWVSDKLLVIEHSVPLAFSTIYEITLNPVNGQKMFRDKAGNELETTILTFTTINKPQPEVTLSLSSITFIAILGGQSPQQQSFEIVNTGEVNSKLNWVANIVYKESADWLIVTPSSGVINKGDQQNVSISVDISKLSTGTYHAEIEIIDSKAINSPQKVYVVLEVLTPQNIKFLLQGKVVDNSQKPLPDVTIKLIFDNTELLTYSDADGNYKFLSIDGYKEYIIVAQKMNYIFTPSSITIYVDKNVLLEEFVGMYVSDVLHLIDVPLGKYGTSVTVEMPKMSDVKIIVAENLYKEDKLKGTINPDKGESVGIIFNPGKHPNEYLNKKYIVRVFTLMGELIEEFTKVPQMPDDVWVRWVPKDLASGVYIIYVEGPGVNVKKKVVIIR